MRQKATVNLSRHLVAWLRGRPGELSDVVETICTTHYAGDLPAPAAAGDVERVTIQIGTRLVERAKRHGDLSAYLASRLGLAMAIESSARHESGRGVADAIYGEMKAGKLNRKERASLERRERRES